MKNPVVVVGVGEIGSVFSRGFMRLGYPVYPVVRDMDMSAVAAEVAEPELVLIAVGEADLHNVLSAVPQAWRDRLVLIQNELLPGDWQQYDLSPTVISVWFEKKKGMDSKVLIPSPVYGDHAQLVSNALASLDIATVVLDSAEALLHELVLKNVYILTTNIAGLRVGGNVGELWDKHQDFARAVAGQVIQLQEKLTTSSLDTESLIAGMLVAFNGDLNHGCMGRSAPARLARVLSLAKQHNLNLSLMQEIADEA